MAEPHQPPFSGMLDTHQKLQAYLDSCPPGLTKLNLGVTQMHSLQGVNFPSGLRELRLNDNLITTLEGVHFPHELKRLHLYNNQIDSLEGVKFPSTLEHLYLANNRITTLQGVQFPRGLTTFNFQDNPLISLAGMINPSSIIKNYFLVHYNSLYLRDIEGVRLTLQAARQSQKATLKKMTDLSQHSMQIQLSAVTSFLREGMKARAQQHADQLLRDKEEKPTTYEQSLFYAKLNEKMYPVPMIEEFAIRDVLNYLNEHYYISVLHNCGDMHLHKPGAGKLESGHTLKECGVVSDNVLDIVCGTQKGGHHHSRKRNKRSQKRRNKSKSKSKKNGHRHK
jgi:hypothetical protein